MIDIDFSTFVQPKRSVNDRIHMLDEVRGLALLLMILYHAGFSMYNIYLLNIGYEILRIMNHFIILVSGAFILISGMCSMLSRNIIMRGFKLFIAAITVYIVTLIATPSFPIKFGILHFLSLAMIILGLIKPVINKIPVWIGLIVSTVLFLLTYGIQYGELGIPNLLSYALPHWLYETDIFFPIGFHTSTFTSGDYFPFLPWLFLFLFGSFLGVWAKQGKFPKFMYKNRIPPLSFVGRHTLIIYLVHQPVIIGVLLILVNIFHFERM